MSLHEMKKQDFEARINPVALANGWEVQHCDRSGWYKYERYEQVVASSVYRHLGAMVVFTNSLMVDTMSEEYQGKLPWVTKPEVWDRSDTSKKVYLNDEAELILLLESPLPDMEAERAKWMAFGAERPHHEFNNAHEPKHMEWFKEGQVSK